MGTIMVGTRGLMLLEVVCLVLLSLPSRASWRACWSFGAAVVGVVKLWGGSCYGMLRKRQMFDIQWLNDIVSITFSDMRNYVLKPRWEALLGHM